MTGTAQFSFDPGEFAGKRARYVEQAGAALPSLSPFLEFPGARILGVAALAFQAMAPIQP